MNNFNIKFNKSNFKQINSHLLSVSNLFIPSLSSYVNIEKYSSKLINNANRFEVFDNDKLIALLAFYEKSDEIFVTNLSVCKTQLNNGIAKSLIFELFDYSKTKFIRLEVFKLNKKAIKFYLLNDFYIKQELEEKFILEWKK